MKQFWLGFVLLLSITVIVFAGEKVIRVTPEDLDHLEFLSSLEGRQDLEIDFWKSPRRIGLAVDMHVTESAYKILAQLLKTKNIKFQILIFDVEMMVENERSAQSRSISNSWYSEYHRLNEIVDELNNLANQSPLPASVFSVGRSYEGREQLAIKLQGKPKPNKKIFFMNCGIHAREWVSPATCMYIIKQIVSKYGKDATVTEMMDKMDFVIMPVLNVDGYEFTWIGNRFWRKTRKPNRGSRCVGTDPNRNWGYKWGFPGASRDPCNDAYRGSHAFSEVEVLNVAKYLESLSTRGVVAGYMDVHAYSQLWMIPWGYTTTPSKDHAELMRVSKIATTAIQQAGYGTYYKHGPSSVIIYSNSGGSKDYTYGELGIKYSFALELRDRGQYGFLLPRNQIIPTGMETFQGIKAMALAMDV